MTNRYILPALVLLAALGFALAPFVTPPFTGFTADQLPVPQIDPPVQPAGYAFAIWGLIYLGLVGSALFGLVARAGDEGWDAARGPLLVSLVLGIPWLAIANASAIWATVVIVAMALTAIAALWRTPERDLWTLRLPIGLYAGWLTAASWVSIGSTLAGYGIGPDQVGWALIGVAGAGLVALSVLWWGPRAPGYAFTAGWALVGIMVKNGTELPSVTLAAGVALVLICLVLASRYLRPETATG